MKTAMRKSAARMLALLLSAVLLMGMVPVSAAGNSDNTSSSDDGFSRIVHLDMGRKYFSPGWIKNLIDEMAKLGYNQLELDFGNSEDGQLRFKLNNMDITYEATETEMVPMQQEMPEQPADTTEQPADTTEQPADTTEQPADTTEQPAEATDEVSEAIQQLADNASVMDQTIGMASNDVMVLEAQNTKVEKTVNLDSAFVEGEYLTEGDMTGIIDYADENGIEIVPLLNSPGHFGAVLCAADAANKDFRYQNSNSLDITNGEAVAFGQAVVAKYAQWFYEKGCRTFNIGADEFYTEGGSFGSLSPADYELFADYVNDLYDVLKEIGYTTIRAFNDGFYYNNQTNVSFKNFEICYWSSGYGGYDVASAATIQQMGHSLINAHGDYYYIVGGGNSPMMKGELDASSFSATEFMGGTIENPAGAMFCIWSDNNDSEENVWEDLFEDPAYLLDYTTGLKGTVTQTDEETGVKVTANGLTGLTVKAASLENSPYTQYVAYEMTPVTDAGTYTGEAEVTIPLGNLKDYNANRLTGFVVNGDGTVQEVPGTKNSDGTYTFTMPHFSVGGVALVEATYTMPDGYKGAVEQKTATGETYYEKVSGANAITASDQYLIVGSYSSWGTSYYYAMTPSGGATEVSPSSGRIDGSSYDSDLWTFEGVNGSYYLKDSNGEYAYPNANRNWGWSYSLSTGQHDGRAVTVNGSDTVTIGRKVTSGWNDDNTTSYITLDSGWGTRFDAGSNGSALTLYKKVTVPGGTYYTVGTAGMNALLAAVPSTNGGVYTEASWAPFAEALQAAQTALGNVKDSYETQQAANLDQDALNSAAEALYTAWQGLKNDPDYVPAPSWTPIFQYYIANDHSVVNASGKNTSNAIATTSGKPISEMVDEWVTRTASGREGLYWRTYVQSGPKQDGLEDLTDEGKNIGTQAVSLKYDGTNWLYETTDGQWYLLSQEDQLTTYYVEKTTVSDEVTVFVSDWGSDPYNSGNDNIWGWLTNGAISLSFQTVYADTGSVSPEDLRTTTQFTGTDTQYSVIEILNSAEYEVVNVTLLRSTFTGNSANSFRLSGFDDPDMENETSIYNEDGSVQAIPKVGKEGDRTAWLVRIYVKPVEKENTLTIKYVDETSASNVEIYTGSVNAYSNYTFYNAVTKNGTTFGNLDAHALRTMTSAEMDGSYILNAATDEGKPEYFNTDLKAIPAIDAKYKSGIYSYTGAAISDEGRTLTFYYKANTANTASYVVDFGLPVSIPVADLVANPNDVQQVTVDKPQYGTATATTSSITYTPTNILKSTDTIQVTISYGTSSSVTALVYLYPASTVYYEAEDKSFVYFEDGTGNMSWSKGGTSETRQQKLEKLGSHSYNFGYDEAYATNELGWSNGAAQSVTVSANGFDSSSSWPTASFTFTGTGVDIISQTDAKAGIILVDVNEGTNSVKKYIVNNYYGYVYDIQNNTWTTSDDNGNNIDSIYQVPVIAVRDLKYSTYTVTITVGYDPLFDVAKKGEFQFYLDAIRVYNPLGENSSVYAADDEANPTFVPVHNRVLEFGTTGTLVDGKTNATLVEFKHVGPNNEVYLAPGQSVTLTMREGETGTAQLAARIISDTGPATLSVGGTPVTVKSTVDEYYEAGTIGSSVTIENTGDCTIALTMLKIFNGKN